MSTVTFATPGFSVTRAARPTQPRPAQPRPAQPRPAQPRLRITRRGRVVLGALIAAPLALALSLSAFSGAPAEAGSTVSTASFEHISVASGESLWDLAAWIAPEADPRDVVASLVELNQLQTTEVQPGQVLAIPAQYAK